MIKKWINKPICKIIRRHHNYYYEKTIKEGNDPWKTKYIVKKCNDCGKIKKVAV